MADNTIHAVAADFLDPALYGDEGPVALPSLRQGTLLAALSYAFDVAEARRPGHAQRVAYIGTSLARELELDKSTVEEVFFAGLLHDAGMAAAQTPASTARHRDRRRRAQSLAASHSWTSLVDMLGAHTEAGAAIARRLGLSEAVSEAVASHHDYWDADDATPSIVARLVSSADRIESLLDSGASPLRLRRRSAQTVQELAGNEIDASVAAAMTAISASDTFWLGFHETDLTATLNASGYGTLLAPNELVAAIAAVSDVVDTRNDRTPGHGRSVAELARKTALASGLSEPRAEMVYAAALLQDLGTLGVPVSHLRKRDILTIEEMAQVHLHPTFARDIISEIPGFGAAAWWVGCHHERVDGKGYPSMLEGDGVPLEAQIIGIAETFVALTSDRPHRRSMPASEAIKVLHGLSAARFAPEVVATFEATAGPFDEAE